MLFVMCAAALAVLGGEARSQPAWRPEKPVEIIVPTGAGGANDIIARVVQKTLQDQKEFTKWLESEYVASRAALTDLGYAKNQ